MFGPKLNLGTWGPKVSPLAWITAIPVVEGSPRQHHRVLIGPF